VQFRNYAEYLMLSYIICSGE